MWCAVGITFEGNSGNGDDRTLGQPLVQMGIFGLAFSQREPPPIIMDHDCNVIRIVEGRCATIERRIIEVPLRRSKLQDELRKIVPVFVVACPAAFGGKIKLVPPFELSLWRQRHLAGFLAADQITAHRHHGLAALRQSAAMILAVRAPQSKPASIALSILRASMKAMVSTATADGWPLRNVSSERKRVVP